MTANTCVHAWHRLKEARLEWGRARLLSRPPRKCQYLSAGNRMASLEEGQEVKCG